MVLWKQTVNEEGKCKQILIAVVQGNQQGGGAGTNGLHGTEERFPLGSLYVIFDIIDRRPIQNAVQSLGGNGSQLCGTVGKRLGAVGIKGCVSVTAGIKIQCR